MDARLLVEDKFMKSNQFGRGDVPREPMVTIAGVEKKEIGEGLDPWWVLTFKEPWAKPLKLQRTHQRACIVMFGGDTDGWTGKRLCLYAMPGKFFGGEAMGGSDSAVRIAGSPDLKQAVTFAVRGYGKGKTYELKPMPVAKSSSAPGPMTPAEKAWALWCEAGFKQERDAFKEVITAATGKATSAELVDADVEVFAKAVAARKHGPVEPGAEG